MSGILVVATELIQQGISEKGLGFLPPKPRGDDCDTGRALPACPGAPGSSSFS